MSARYHEAVFVHVIIMLAQAVSPLFQAKTRELAVNMGLQGYACQVPPPKTFSRANNKELFDYYNQPSPKGGFNIDIVRSLMAAPTAEEIHKLLPAVSTHYGSGIAKCKNMFAFDQKGREDRFNLLAILVTVVFETGFTFGELCKQADVQATWDQYCAACPDGSTPRERWVRLTRQARDYLESDFLNSVPVVILGEVQLMPLSFVGVRHSMHEPYKVYRAGTPAQLYTDYLNGLPSGSIQHRHDTDNTENVQDAAYDGQLNVVAAFLNERVATRLAVGSLGFDVDGIVGRAYSGKTLLGIAAGNGHADIAHLLLERKADVDWVDRRGFTPLDWALSQGHTDLVHMLEDAGATRGSCDGAESTGTNSPAANTAGAVLDSSAHKPSRTTADSAGSDEATKLGEDADTTSPAAGTHKYDPEGNQTATSASSDSGQPGQGVDTASSPNPRGNIDAAAAANADDERAEAAAPVPQNDAFPVDVIPGPLADRLGIRGPKTCVVGERKVVLRPRLGQAQVSGLVAHSWGAVAPAGLPRPDDPDVHEWPVPLITKYSLAERSATNDGPLARYLFTLEAAVHVDPEPGRRHDADEFVIQFESRFAEEIFACVKREEQSFLRVEPPKPPSEQSRPSFSDANTGPHSTVDAEGGSSVGLREAADAVWAIKNRTGVEPINVASDAPESSTGANQTAVRSGKGSPSYPQTSVNGQYIPGVHMLDLDVPHIGHASRAAAEEELKKGGMNQGDYVVRRTDTGGFGLVIAYKGVAQHYKIDKHNSRRTGRTKFGIQDGLRWEFLNDLIMHYHDESDGLCCELRRNIKRSASAVEIDPRHLRLGQQLGEGEFGVSCPVCLCVRLLRIICNLPGAPFAGLSASSCIRAGPTWRASSPSLFNGLWRRRPCAWESGRYRVSRR